MENSNTTKCFVNDDRYQKCTWNILDSRHKYFPVPIVFGSVLTLISSFALSCLCYGFSDDDKECIKSCPEIVKCPWLFHCCLSHWNLKFLKTLPCVFCKWLFKPRFYCYWDCKKVVNDVPGGP